ncbi:MAG TPA: FAD-binding and (Fe-S)-binding domain-containing protein [Pseudonocardia sp.]|nr:FAD-binding and (Fe-S)-binding domain-containing protein [Pseudonocardia sp.]
MNTDRVRGLAADLGRSVAGEVWFDDGARARYSADASNYRHVPIGVVRPRDPDDVAAAMATCREHDVPVLPRGTGTSIAGNAVNVAVVLDLTRLNRISEVDPDARTAYVQPGVVCDALRDAGRPHGLTFGPDPSTHNRCTIGGMIGNNACGSHSVAWGKTVDNVRELDVLTYSGQRFTVGRGVPADGPIVESLRALTAGVADEIRTGFPDLTRRVSGYNLDQLLPENGFNLAKSLVGTEGTCVTVLGARMDLVESPPARALAVLGFADAYVAAEHVMAVRAHSPLTIEGMDTGLIAALRTARPLDTTYKMLPDGGGWLYIETGGATTAEAEAAAEAVAEDLKRHAGASSMVVSDPAVMRRLWRIREDGAGIVTRGPGGTEAWPGWEDAAVPPEKLSSYLREFDKLLSSHGRHGAYYGHFGDGCLHVRIDFDFSSTAGIANFRRFMEEGADLVVAHGGSLSGEHGDGQARAELLPRMYPPRLIEAFGEFKAAWDPDGRMNPRRVVEPAKMDEDLRVFVGLPTMPDTPQLAFAHDRGSFTRATRRCLGVARCVTDGGGVMCPSYQVTGEDKHSTRGRARLLFEMAAGSVITEGWKSPEVAEAMDLCLSCKGCKRECPVGVDMAAYKTEYLAQRYQGRLRPRSHYAMGALPRWLRLAAAVPGVAAAANAASRVSALAAVAKKIGGVAPERDIPPLAKRTFRGSLRRSRRADGTAHSPAPSAGRRILLWPDTFTDHFDPEIGHAAVSVLEALGYRVEVPPKPVCCGLTWYSTGQVATARRVLQRSLAVLRPWLDEGVPVVGLEPSCLAALRADAGELLPGDPAATALAGSIRTFAEVLAQHREELAGLVEGRPTLRALVQVHCHQHADLGSDDDTAVLSALGVQAEVLDSGCCGLAGNWGFEEGHYEVSMACAERVLLPAVRAADDDVAVLADGFSCRTQLRQAGQREPVHLAQIAARALGLGPS